MSPARSLDSYYTPPWMAKEVAGALPEMRCGIVADFAAGEGSLLDAAEQRFGASTQYVATDKSHTALRYLSTKRPVGWTLGRLDVFSARSRNASQIWRSSAKRVDGLVLNPPFSYRGGEGLTLSEAGVSIKRASPAVSFLRLALTRLAPGGTAAVLLPANALRSERDEQTWEEISLSHKVAFLERYERTAFVRAHAATVLVSVTRISAIASGSDNADQSKCISSQVQTGGTAIDLIRGRVPVHAVDESSGEGGATFVHSTDLIRQRGSLVADSSLATSGILVLLPRVGKPDAKKVRLVPAESAPIVLSDCVFALRVPTTVIAADLMAAITSQFHVLERAYGGSCAPYLTIRNLVRALEELGFIATHVPASN